MIYILQFGVAGTFYPSNPDECQRLVNRCLDHADKNRPIPKAIISPHAGFIYSGEVAAEAYACLSNARKQITRVVLFGPSHRYPFDGIALTTADGYLTPLGIIPIDQAYADRIERMPQVDHLDDAFDLQENSLETQLPFL